MAVEHTTVFRKLLTIWQQQECCAIQREEVWFFGELSNVVDNLTGIFPIRALEAYNAASRELAEELNFNAFECTARDEAFVELQASPNVLFSEVTQLTSLLFMFISSTRMAKDSRKLGICQSPVDFLLPRGVGYDRTPRKIQTMERTWNSSFASVNAHHKLA
jgi:hypothetical protein